MTAADDRLSAILAGLSAGGAAGWSSTRFCEAAKDVIGVSGAGVMLMCGDVPLGSVCTTNSVSNLIEELQFTLGEGPCVDAYVQSQVVLEPNLTEPATPRWLAFSRQAVDAGVRAVFAFPLRVGTVALGALDLYRDTPGPLSEDQHANALFMAGVVANWVLDVQAKAPPGSVAEELEQDADFRFIVYEAAGAVSVQLGVSVTEALVRLRAYAFLHDRLLAEVAEDVLNRRLRF